MLNNRPRDTDHISFLERIGADQMTLDLTGDNDHRDGVHVSSGDTCNGISRTRTTGYKYYPGSTCSPGIAIRHMSGCLLMSHQNMLNPVLLEESIIDMQHSAARITEDIVNAFVLECSD